jgi:DNA-directed RNA polymerase specialized sigma24 family protein
MDPQAVHPELYRMAQECAEGLTDEELMLVLCDFTVTFGDNLFSELFRRYRIRVTSRCLRLTRNRGRAPDLAQEVFFKAYVRRYSFRGDSKFSTWLYAITRKHCLSSRRRLPTPVDVGQVQSDFVIDRTTAS